MIPEIVGRRVAALPATRLNQDPDRARADLAWLWFTVYNPFNSVFAAPEDKVWIRRYQIMSVFRQTIGVGGHVDAMPRCRIRDYRENPTAKNNAQSKAGLF